MKDFGSGCIKFNDYVEDLLSFSLSFEKKHLNFLHKHVVSSIIHVGLMGCSH